MKKQRVLAGTIGALVLGGVLVASYGGGVAPAEAQTTTTSVIISKLNQILALLTGAAGQGNHTLRWDTNNPSATRFTVLAAIPGAVLDNNTGLVWEQAPDGTLRSWGTATSYCVNKNVGGTRGWRLPSVPELASLIDPTLPAPFVPASAFTISTSDTTPGVQSAGYWSASSIAVDPFAAWNVIFSSGSVFNLDKANSNHAWCVRGGMNADAY